MVTSLASVSNSKFYIPGETKEVQALRRKAILNGLIIFIQYLVATYSAASDLVKDAL